MSASVPSSSASVERRVDEVLGLRRRVVVGRLAHPHRPETRLRLAQEVARGAVRRHRARTRRAERPCGLALDDRAAEPERELGDAFLRAPSRRSDRSERPRDAGDVRVVARPVPPPDDLLDEDRHPLALSRPDAARGRRARREERRGPDELDRLDHPAEARVGVELVVRRHLRAVDAGERVLERVLEEARRAQRERRAHVLHQRAQVARRGRPAGSRAGTPSAISSSRRPRSRPAARSPRGRRRTSPSATTVNVGIVTSNGPNASAGERPRRGARGAARRPRGLAAERALADAREPLSRAEARPSNSA